MRASLAELFNDAGNSAKDAGRNGLARQLYRIATLIFPRWHSPWFNLGLEAKHRGDWAASLKFNQRSVELAPQDQASLWNLGIAATALKDWDEAYRAWSAYGIKVLKSEDGVLMAPVTGCVRLNPKEHGEVVWGDRIDPARMRVLNIPFPESQRRYGDIVLNDGAPEGHRMNRGKEYPVFNELALWKASAYSTFRVTIYFDDDAAEQRLKTLCESRDIGIEDWGTVRSLCTACSLGNPGEHACTATDVDGEKNYAFASTSLEGLVSVLEHWAETEEEDVDFSEPLVALVGMP